MLSKRQAAAFASAVTLGVGAAGCGSSGSSGVSAASYVHSVCSAVGPFAKDVQAKSSQLNLTSIKSAAQGKQALQSFLTSISSDTGTAVTQLKKAGTPNVTNGKKVSSAMLGVFEKLDTTIKNADTQANSLPTSSPKAFQTAAASLGTSVESSMNGIGAGLNGLKSPALEKAAQKDATCKSIGAT